MLNIERVHNISRTVFEEEYLSKNKPVIITGALNNWSAFSKWTDEYLIQKFGEDKLDVHVHSKEQYSYDFGQKMQKLTMKEYLDIRENSELKYYISAMIDSNKNNPLLDKFISKNVQKSTLDIFQDISLPYLNLEDYLSTVMFMGDDTAILHQHHYHEAFLCTIKGEKRIKLYRPEDTNNLYPFQEVEENRPLQFWSNQIDFNNIDYEKFPNFKNVECAEVTILPTELLFIPVHWWHLVTGLKSALSVSMFWTSKILHWRFPVPGLRTLLGLERYGFREELVHLLKASQQ